jgi:hypothetical protein
MMFPGGTLSANPRRSCGPTPMRQKGITYCGCFFAGTGWALVGLVKKRSTKNITVPSLPAA